MCCSRQTILAKLNTQDSSELQYMPGDHAGIFPANPAELVEAILSRLHNAPPPDQVLKTEILTESNSPLGQWLAEYVYNYNEFRSVLSVNFKGSS